MTNNSNANCISLFLQAHFCQCLQHITIPDSTSHDEIIQKLIYIGFLKHPQVLIAIENTDRALFCPKNMAYLNTPPAWEHQILLPMERYCIALEHIILKRKALTLIYEPFSAFMLIAILNLFEEGSTHVYISDKKRSESISKTLTAYEPKQSLKHSFFSLDSISPDTYYDTIYVEAMTKCPNFPLKADKIIFGHEIQIQIKHGSRPIKNFCTLAYPLPPPLVASNIWKDLEDLFTPQVDQVGTTA